MLEISRVKRQTKSERSEMKRLFSMLISTALVLSAYGFMQSNAVAKTGAASHAMQRRVPAIRFVRRQIREVNRKQRLTITAKYPQAIGSQNEGLEKLNSAIKSMVTEQIAAFKKDFSPSDMPGGVGSSFELSYIVELATNNLVSITFAEDSYNEGAAHPSHVTVTFNYDLNAGRVLKLADLFKPNSSYLKPISDYSIASLRRQLRPNPDMDWIRKGAAPETDNYNSWAITRRGLKVNFDAYQVASYAEGPHIVVVPFSVLRGVIESNGPLGGMKN
jgi:hypothetical protein